MSLTNKKMSGKQAITGAFDLDSFVGKAEVPDQVALKSVGATDESTLAEATKSPSALSKQSTLSQKENLSVRVQIRMTPSEFDRLERGAGLIPHSKFLRQFLKDHGLL